MLPFPRFRLNVAAKAALLIVGLALMSALADWFILQRIDRIDAINNRLSLHMAPARLSLAEAKMGLNGLGLNIYKLTSVTDPDSVRDAAQTSHALASIKEKTGAVGEIIEAVRGATKSMSNVVAQIEEISRAIMSAVRLQSDATQKIAESVDGAAGRTRQVADTIAGVSESTGETRVGAQQILQAVADLNCQAATLQEEAHLFVGRVRAA